MKYKLRPLATCVLAIAFVTPVIANAGVPDCDVTVEPKPLLTDQGGLEAIAFDAQGRLYLSNIGKNNVTTLTSKNANPEVLVDPVSQPGGLAIGDSDELYVGAGNGLGGFFPYFGSARILKVDTRTGAKEKYAEGLAMANGVVRAGDGTIYASDDLAQALDRILPDGTVEAGWLKLNSNGMALSNDGKTLFVNRSIPSRVMAVDLETEAVRPYSKYSFATSISFFDGLAIDTRDQLYVAAYFMGAILKVNTDGEVCKLAGGMSLTSAAAFGVNPQGAEEGFSETSLFVTSHNGTLYELPGVLD